MAYLYQLLEAAQKEYEDSVFWYIERSSTAAENFMIAINHTLQLICTNPKRWHNKYKNFSELGVEKYPFNVIYTIDDLNQIDTVIAIYHHKRNPRKSINEKNNLL